MKQVAKTIVSFVIVLCMSILGVVTTPIFHAKAESASYVKVTQAPSDWSGTYLIVYEAGSVAFDGSLTLLEASNNNVSVTITDRVITATDLNTKTFKIAKSGNNYTVQSASGYYIGCTADGNKLQASTSTQFTNTISLNNDGSAHIVSSGKAVLRYNAASGDCRFRYYKSNDYKNQKAIHLYKLTEATGEGTEEETSVIPGENTEIQNQVNEIKSYMSLAYQYTQKTVITDTLNKETTEISGTSYAEWSGKTATSSAVYAETVLADSEFRIRCAIDASVSNKVEGITSYGICVTAGEKSVNYTEGKAASWGTEGDLVYVVISLGDIINDLNKLKTDFTVQAYVIVGNEIYYTENENKKTHSVASMVNEYYTGEGTTADVQKAVKHLYDYLKKNGLIVEEVS